jgi:hypothetical protein
MLTAGREGDRGEEFVGDSMCTQVYLVHVAVVVVLVWSFFGVTREGGLPPAGVVLVRSWCGLACCLVDAVHTCLCGLASLAVI